MNRQDRECSRKECSSLLIFLVQSLLKPVGPNGFICDSSKGSNYPKDCLSVSEVSTAKLKAMNRMKFQCFMYVYNLSINIDKHGLHTCKWSLASISSCLWGRELLKLLGSDLTLRSHRSDYKIDFFL